MAGALRCQPVVLVFPGWEAKYGAGVMSASYPRDRPDGARHDRRSTRAGPEPGFLGWPITPTVHDRGRAGPALG
jgi:hypothetical protein